MEVDGMVPFKEDHGLLHRLYNQLGQLHFHVSFGESKYRFPLLQELPWSAFFGPGRDLRHSKLRIGPWDGQCWSREKIGVGEETERPNRIHVCEGVVEVVQVQVDRLSMATSLLFRFQWPGLE